MCTRILSNIPIKQCEDEKDSKEEVHLQGSLAAPEQLSLCVAVAICRAHTNWSHVFVNRHRCDISIIITKRQKDDQWFIYLK